MSRRGFDLKDFCEIFDSFDDQEKFCKIFATFERISNNNSVNRYVSVSAENNSATYLDKANVIEIRI